VAPDWEALVSRPDVDVVVVATTNDMLAPVTHAAVRAGKHVVVEKPAARSAAEIEPVVETAQRAFRDAGVVVKVGFNHRFHPAFIKAREIFDTGALGELMFLRARYGHGGRKGMETEWRGDPQIAGGGEMLDQGVHLIDLSRWFLGEFSDVSGHVARYFWDWRVEDNGFAMLRTDKGQVAWLHASCTEWKNLFSFELYGRDGKLAVDGLGGSYGVERLAYYKMLPQMGPPQTTIWEYPGEDRSWHLEWAHFLDCVRQRRQPGGNLDDALAALRVVDRLYEFSPRIA
jgi:predicted dehydrogenase